MIIQSSSTERRLLGGYAGAVVPPVPPAELADVEYSDAGLSALRLHLSSRHASGATPLVVSDGRHVLGVIELSDVVKFGLKERFARLREMGIRTLIITGRMRKRPASRPEA